jgi:putative DNA methylase
MSSMTSTTVYARRLIEVDLPIKRISAHARREKSIRHGHISTLHIWWARRPLAACRAVICAALWPDPADPLCPHAFRDAATRIITEFARKACGQGKIGTANLMGKCSEKSLARWQVLSKPGDTLDTKDVAHLNLLRFALLDFIADFANWDNSTVPEYLETARALTQAAHEALGGEPGTRPLVVDPFAGGGSIPLEALRVGADAFATDLNPVAVPLNKVVLEFIPKYGQKLADDVRKWGHWLKEQAERELSRFYPSDRDGAIPVAYFWTRTILCQAPGHGMVPVEVPLLKSMWLAKKRGRYRALRWKRDQKGKIQSLRIEKLFADGQRHEIQQPLLETFEPRNEKDVERGTSAGGSATCPITGYTSSVEEVRRQIKARKGGAEDSRLICVVLSRPGQTGRFYRLSTDADSNAVNEAVDELRRRKEAYSGELSLVPEGTLNHLRGFFNIVLYGMEAWGDLFTTRQLLALTTMAGLALSAGRQLSESERPDYVTAVQTCLALTVDRQADKLSSLCRWDTSRENPQGTFGRQALPMIWDYSEINPFSGSGGDWNTALDWVIRVIEQESRALAGDGRPSGHSEHASATAHPLPDHSSSIVFTDPPYYAAVPYADLSDFFYSWLRRSLRNRFPELLNDDLTPKAEECVALSHRAAMYRNKDGSWFETRIRLACKEACRITTPHGVGVFVFASKETPAWEAMLAGLVDSDWVVTGSWPIDTEMGSRLRARNSAVLASSIHIVGRPRTTTSIGDWRDVLTELPRRIHEWMPRLAEEGIVGADAIFACLGPALEIYSRYSRVEKATGKRVELREYLEHVWATVAKEALSMIFAGADATGFDPDARLTAMWFWTISSGLNDHYQAAKDEVREEDTDDEEAGKTPKAIGFVLEYDAARKIAQGLGAHLEQLTSVVEVKGDKARLLPISERARHLFGKDEGRAPTKRAKTVKQKSLFDEPDGEGGEEGNWGELTVPQTGATVLDRLHQAMILFAAGRGEALRRFLVEEGVGRDTRFWRLAQALSALYPPGSEEKRWVDGVLGRKKGLGF